ncbi:MAG TPA: methionine aminotransferase [Fluviicola sp.]|nr:methionine aminotransferase [Fluviicola sp.]
MQSKLPKVGTTIFTTMSKLAVEHQAINLSQGFPNFPVDPVLVDLLEKNSRDNIHQYAPMPGNLILMENLGELIYNQYKRQIHVANELLITAGATEGIFITIQALVQHGDEVVVLDPAYDCYDPAIILAGGKAIHINLNDDFSINWKQLREAVNQKTKMLIINNPHNPSGKTLTSDDIQSLIQLLNDRPNLILCSDEVYEFITFEREHLSAHQEEVLRNNSVIVSSFGKTFHITGWKIGYLVAPEKLMKEIKKVHQYVVFSVNSVAQKTLADYLEKVKLEDLSPFYNQKRLQFQKLMKGSRFDLLPCEGTYFQTARYDKISKLNDLDFCNWLVKEVGVAAIPLSVFYDDATDNHVIRFCFAKTDETLIQATDKLCKI